MILGLLKVKLGERSLQLHCIHQLCLSWNIESSVHGVLIASLALERLPKARREFLLRLFLERRFHLPLQLRWAGIRCKLYVVFLQ